MVYVDASILASEVGTALDEVSPPDENNRCLCEDGGAGGAALLGTDGAGEGGAGVLWAGCACDCDCGCDGADGEKCCEGTGGAVEYGDGGGGACACAVFLGADTSVIFGNDGGAGGAGGARACGIACSAPPAFPG